jgi:hypothetical protein
VNTTRPHGGLTCPDANEPVVASRHQVALVCAVYCAHPAVKAGLASGMSKVQGDQRGWRSPGRGRWPSAATGAMRAYQSFSGMVAAVSGGVTTGVYSTSMTDSCGAMAVECMLSKWGVSSSYRRDALLDKMLLQGGSQQHAIDDEVERPWVFCQDATSLTTAFVQE